MTFLLNFEHKRDYIDPIVDELAVLEAVQKFVSEHVKDFHAGIVKWSAVANEVMAARTKAGNTNTHWHWYPDGRILIWTDLLKNESFADLFEIYERLSSHAEQIAPLYKGSSVCRPDPDDTDAITYGSKDRQWRWSIGGSDLVLSVSFFRSEFCQIETKTEMQEVEVRKVICSDISVISHPALADAGF